MAYFRVNLSLLDYWCICTCKKTGKIVFSISGIHCISLSSHYCYVLVPFEAPEKLIVLKDPFVEMFGSGESLTKDLFFSGHTATLFLLFLVVESKCLKYVFLVSAIIVGVAIVLQHVHYVIDVFAAPFFTYACFVFVSSLNLNKITQTTTG